MPDETWVLMSTDTLDEISDINSRVFELQTEAIHATPVEMETDPNIHRHLDDGGVVIIHCEVD